MNATNQSGYGDFLNLPPGSKTDRRFVDNDGDGTDDRYQSGPGKPRGGGTGGVKPMPVKPSPVRPTPINPPWTGPGMQERDILNRTGLGMQERLIHQTPRQAPTTPLPPGLRPDYQRGRRKRGLGSLRTM